MGKFCITGNPVAQLQFYIFPSCGKRGRDFAKSQWLGLRNIFKFMGDRNLYLITDIKRVVRKFLLFYKKDTITGFLLYTN